MADSLTAGDRYRRIGHDPVGMVEWSSEAEEYILGQSIQAAEFVGSE
jgi:hypothetical protein